MVHILAIDDKEENTELIADWFKPPAFRVTRAHSGREGLDRVREDRPDVILLDIVMPPGMDGHEVLLRLKRDPATASIPVIIVSFKADELDGLKDLMRSGLREGAAYVMGPTWGLPALEEVIRSVLAGRERPPSVKVGADELRLGPGCTEVEVNGRRIAMSRRQAEVLAYLDEHRGESCSVKDILEFVYKGVGGESGVYKVVARIQKKIEPHPGRETFIYNVKNYGYRLGPGPARSDG
jgi:two-component system response regulator MprA